MDCIDCIAAGGKDFEKLDENNYCPQCEKTLCPECWNHMYHAGEEMRCEVCNEDYCQVCDDYISEGMHGLCRDCLSLAANEYIYQNN